MLSRIMLYVPSRNDFPAMMDMSDICGGWKGVRLQLYVGLIGSLVSIAISVWQMNSYFQLPKNTLESDGLKALGLSADWTEEICHKYPYAMYSPISFKWSYLGESGGLAVCPWPLETSIYRLALAGFTIIINIFALSYGISTTRNTGRVVFPILMLTWYSAFIVDIANLIQAYTMCLNKFSESNLGDKVSRVLSLDITCTYGQSAIPVVINFFMFGCILLIARYWHNSRHRIEETDTDDMLKKEVKEDDIILF